MCCLILLWQLYFEVNVSMKGLAGHLSVVSPPSLLPPFQLFGQICMYCTTENEKDADVVSHNEKQAVTNIAVKFCIGAVHHFNV